MDKINSTDDLPAWFRADKYLATKNFRAADWYEQLNFRKQLLQGNPKYPCAAELPDSELASAMEFWRRVVTERASPLRRQPIKRTDIKSVMIVRGMPQPLCVQYDGGLTSRPLSNEDMPIRTYKMLNLMGLALGDHLACSRGERDQVLSERWGILNNRYGTSFSVEGRLGNSSLGTFSKQVVSVDLSASDNDLKAAFDAWLAQVRAETPPPSKSQKPLYDRWSRYGLLPYLDLLIWSMETGTRLPDRVMAAAVLPRHDSGEGNLRKTIAPLAKALMQDLSELRHVASIETTLQKIEKTEIYDH